MNSAIVEMIATGVSTQMHLRYVCGSSVVLAVLETIALLPEEVSLIWPSEWCPVKVLYLLSRYLVFVPGAMSIVFASDRLATSLQCQTQFAALTVPTIVGISIAEALLYLRVHALVGSVGKKRISGIALGVLFVGLHVGMYVTLAEFVRTVRYSPSPFPTVLPCYLEFQNPKLLANAYIMILASEIVIMLVTLWICIIKYRTSKNPIISSLYKDGMGYFLILSLISVGNILCHFVAPLNYIYLFSIPQAVLHSILSTRMVLHLRKVAGKGGYMPKYDSMQLSTMMGWHRGVVQTVSCDA